ncbi:MAG: HAD hydrolase-like protein, partial [Prevotella sp.]|nr:HAD hydrolase-like protein [Prevotella sp.]
DMTYDILMGSRAGAHTCGVTYGNGTREELLSVNAESIIDDFEQLLTICQE